jgi:hypothetical protein
MKFDKEIADELRRKYKFKNKTLEIWEKKGEIPDYLNKVSLIYVDGMDLRECRCFLNYRKDTALLILKQHGMRITMCSLSNWEAGKLKPNKNNAKKITIIYQILINQKKKLFGL